ncbi:CYR1_4 [Sanghuangporus vaninii]
MDDGAVSHFSKSPGTLTRLTGYVPNLVMFTEQIVERGFAYKSGSGVYLDAGAFEHVDGQENFSPIITIIWSFLRKEKVRRLSAYHRISLKYAAPEEGGGSAVRDRFRLVEEVEARRAFGLLHWVQAVLDGT